ncbi:MAG: 50S ribosome-binding GTPase, partial [Burkholderiaceae bacterium]|nr:50S ribosome-binding GTPase [Burkholderiaceae bacterium]
MIPVLALVGRPNVGKSTLFNRLTNSRDALVADFAGLTRDRLYGEARHEERRAIVIDTGGINGNEEEGIDTVMAGQALLAIEEADLVLLLVDAREGLLNGDQFIVEHLRRRQKPVVLVVNKVDGLDPDQ